MSDTATTAGTQNESRLLRAFRSLNDRKMAAMVILSFAASLPYGAVLGVLTAWLTKEGIGPAIIGAIGLGTMGYAFKYLWAPAFQRARELPFLKIGGRRSWLMALQLAISIALLILAFSNPAQNIGLVTILAFITTLLSPTHDLILDAWRIEVAESEEDKDLMSALYQFGYKFGGFISGFVALILAARIGWVGVYVMIAVFMALCIIGTLLAPEPKATEADEDGTYEHVSYQPSLPAQKVDMGVWIVAGSWLIAFTMIASFLIGFINDPEGSSARTFVRNQGWMIVALTVIVPTLTSAWLVFIERGEESSIRVGGAAPDRKTAITGVLFRAIFDPLMDLLKRLRWGIILVLGLALMYRFTDAVWGSLAYAFYLGENYGALGHSLDDVGIASKFSGVIATIFGAFLGATLITLLGRMPILFIGAIVAAVTNLLYADLAVGGANVDAFLALTRLDIPLVAFAEWAATMQPEAVSIPDDQGQRMARLMLTIFAENIAGGLALVAITAYLTSIVNPRYAAMQYALLVSLTMLLGTLGRAWLGELMEAQGFYHVFVLTFWLGGIAVILCILEWIRQTRSSSDQQSLILNEQIAAKN
ncbi:MAG: MFS transporter [Henriciella sp.]|nr:MFS transporter [Henriciella sp.]